MPKDSVSTQTVEEPQHSEQESVTAAEELTDDQIWESAGEPVEEQSTQQEEEVIEVASEDSEEEAEDTETETFETEAHSEEVSDEDAEEEPKGKHNYEKRYKDLEKEFHKRNEETKELREQFQQLRLERLEEQRELERLRTATQDTQQQKAPTSNEPSPLDDDWLDSDTKQTLEDFSELTAAYKKLMAQEIAKAMSNKGDNSESIQKIAELEKVAQDYQERAYWQQHAAEMRTAIGNDFLAIDQSQEFADYVHSSPMREAIMTQSRDWNDHIAVMKDFLETPVGKAKFRAEPEEPTPQPEAEQKPPESTQQNKGTVRRQAAQGLLKNSSPRQERRPEDMNDEELWDSIAI
jgi:hypothetical protein